MKPWTVDADDIRIASDLDEKLVHRTPSIDAFLRQRSDKFVVTATKGFGKTLLLKAQRIALEERGISCLPDNALIDKPVGDKVFGKQAIRLYSEGTESWRRVWLISIVVATLKSLGYLEDVEVSPRLRSLIDDPSLRSVIDHFVNLLAFGRNDLFRSGDDTDARLLPRLRNVQTPVAIFIDSVDEYFHKHLLNMTASDAGELSPGVWYYSQMGLVEAAYQLRRVCHHLKVFAAVRKEAFARFNETTSMVQQYHGSAIDVSYTRESLREIFANNIRRERRQNLLAPAELKSDPLRAFLGMHEITHGYTQEREPVFDYVYRHTLGRPRDFMTIGQRLSDIPPRERTEVRVKTAVNAAATDIAYEYLNEIQPYVSDIDIGQVLAEVPANVIPEASAATVFAHSHDSLHVLGILFTAGLLGVIDINPVTSAKVQRFLLPGDGRLEKDASLPASSHYLVHPILTQIITSSNPRYLDRVDRTNVLGRGRTWREADADRTLFVLKADIVRFSDLMREGLEETVRKAFHDIAARHTQGCVHWEITNGDALTVVHAAPGELVKAAKRIMEDLYELPRHPRLRVAIDCGTVRLGRGTPELLTGVPFARAARIEPLVTPSSIWVTKSFKDALERSEAFYRAVPVGVAEAKRVSKQESLLNVKKQGSDEEDLWVAVFQIEDRAA